MSGQSNRKKRLGSRRASPNQSETFSAGKHATVDSSEDQHQLADVEEAAESAERVENEADAPTFRRKLGSSRKIGGRQQVKDPDTSVRHVPGEDDVKDEIQVDTTRSIEMTAPVQFEKHENLFCEVKDEMSAMPHDLNCKTPEFTEDYLSSETSPDISEQPTIPDIDESEDYNKESNPTEAEKSDILAVDVVDASVEIHTHSTTEAEEREVQKVPHLSGEDESSHTYSFSCDLPDSLTQELTASQKDTSASSCRKNSTTENKLLAKFQSDNTQSEGLEESQLSASPSSENNLHEELEQVEEDESHQNNYLSSTVSNESAKVMFDLQNEQDETGASPYDVPAKVTDSPNEQDASNPAEKPDRSLEESALAVSDKENEKLDLFDSCKSKISDVDEVALVEIRKIGENIKPNSEHIYHPDKGRVFSETEDSDAALSAFQSHRNVSPEAQFQTSIADALQETSTSVHQEDHYPADLMACLTNVSFDTESHEEKSSSGECEEPGGRPETEFLKEDTLEQEQAFPDVRVSRHEEDDMIVAQRVNAESEQMQCISQDDYVAENASTDVAQSQGVFSEKLLSFPQPHQSEIGKCVDCVDLQTCDEEGLVVPTDSNEAENKESLVVEGLFLKMGNEEPSTYLVYETWENNTDFICDGSSETMSRSFEQCEEKKQERTDTSDSSHDEDMIGCADQDTDLGSVSDKSDFTTSSSHVGLSAELLPNEINSREPPESKKDDTDVHMLESYGNVEIIELPNQNTVYSGGKESENEKPCSTEGEDCGEQEVLSSPLGSFSTNSKMSEHIILSKPPERHSLEDLASQDHEEKTSLPLIEGKCQLHQTSSTWCGCSQETNADEALASHDLNNHLTVDGQIQPKSKLSGGRRKFGSSRKMKGKQYSVVSGGQDPDGETTDHNEPENMSQDKTEDVTTVVNATDISQGTPDKNTNKEKEEKASGFVEALDCGIASVSDVNLNLDKGSSLTNTDVTHDKHKQPLQELEKLTQLMGRDAAKKDVIQSTPASVWTGHSDTQSTVHHDDIINPALENMHASDQKDVFQNSSTQAVSRDDNSQEQVNPAAATDPGEFAVCLPTEDSSSKMETDVDAEGPEIRKEKRTETTRDMPTSKEALSAQEHHADVSQDIDLSATTEKHTNEPRTATGDHSESEQLKTKEKRRKMGSSRKFPHSRKQGRETDALGETKDFIEESGGMTHRVGGLEELLLTAEEIGRENVQLLEDTPVQRDTDEPKAFRNNIEVEVDFHDQEKSEKKGFNHEASATTVQITVNPAQFDKINLEDSQLETVAESSETMSSPSGPLPSSETETSGPTCKTAHSDQDADAELKNKQLRETNEKVKSKPSGTECENPNLNLVTKKRKMGSTRKSLGVKRETFQESKPGDEAIETLTTGQDGATECVPKYEENPPELLKDNNPEEGLAAPLEPQTVGLTDESEMIPLTSERCLMSPNQQGEATGHQLTSNYSPSGSPKSDSVSEAVPEVRRKKFGSNRKTRTHNKSQAASDTGTTEPDTVAGISQEGDAVDGREQERESTHPESISTGSELNKTKAASNISISTSGSENTPARLQQATIHLDQYNPKQLSVGGFSEKSNPKPGGYNVVLIGDSSVGKTSFMKRAQNGKFFSEVQASIGLDSCAWTVVVDGKPVNMCLWDTAGQERFRSLTRQIFHKAHAFLLMYDITSSQSFGAVSYWANCIQEAAVDDVPVLLLGNKSDHSKRQVQTQQGDALAKEYNYAFMECSAATGENVIEALETVGRLLSQRASYAEETTVLHQEPAQKKRSGCC